MAEDASAFNPDVKPTEPGNYIYWSRPIEQPKADEGKAILLKGAGNLLDAGVKTAFDATEQKIRQDTYSAVDPIQEDQLNRLKNLDAQLNQKQDTLLPSKQVLPGDIAKLPDQLEKWGIANDSGKLTNVDYRARLDAAAKNIRSNYSGGMRRVVDEYFEQATGRTAANKEIETRTEALNTLLGQRREQANKIDNKFFDEALKDPVLLPYYKNFKAGLPGSQEAMMTRIAQRNGARTDLQMADLQMDYLTKKRALQKETAQETYAAQAGKDLGLAAHDFTVTGLPGFESGINITDLFNKAQSGEFKPTGEQAVMLKNTIESHKAAWTANMLLLGNQPINPADKNSPSRASLVGGPEEWKKMIDAQASWFDQYSKLTSPTDIGYVAAAHAMLEARQSQAGLEMSRAFPQLTWLAAAAKMDPQGAYVPTMLGQFATDDRWVNKDVAGWAITTGLQWMTQNQGVASTGNNFALTDAFKDGQARGISGPDGAHAFNQTISGVIDAITNKNAPVAIKEAALKTMYGPENKDFLDLIKTSQIDRNGNITPGASTVLANTVNDKVTASVKKFGNPQFIENYVNTGKAFFENVAKRELQQINERETDPNVKFTFDTDTHQWDAVVKSPFEGLGFLRGFGEYLKSGSYLDPRNSLAVSSAPAIQSAVSKLNMALKSMESVSKLTGEDTNVYLVELMIRSGLDPNAMKDSIPHQLLAAAMSALQEPSKVTE